MAQESTTTALYLYRNRMNRVAAIATAIVSHAEKAVEYSNPGDTHWGHAGDAGAALELIKRLARQLGIEA